MYKYDTRVVYSHLDRSGKLSVKAVLDLFQDCATLHTEDEVYSLIDMLNRKRGWFVISYQLKFYRLPEHGDRITVKTIPTKIKGFMGNRLFYLEDETGDILCEAYSEWVFMDLEKLSPVRVPSEIVTLYNTEDVPLDKWGKRKITPANEYKIIKSYKVEGIYVDTNGHMNNAYYVELATRAIEDFSFSNIKIEYRVSAKEGDEIFIAVAHEENRSVVVLQDRNASAFCIVEFS